MFSYVSRKIPMKDSVDEISSVFNLILPLNQQLVTGKEFTNEYFNQVKPGIYEIKPKKIPVLKEIFKGRISYLKSAQTDVKKTFAGKTIGDLQYFKVVKDVMSDFQSKSYDEAYKMDSEEKMGVYNNSRQASLFVYPDGSYGDNGFKKYIEKTKVSLVRQTTGWKIRPELREVLSSDTLEGKLEKLKMYSSKYYKSIKNILHAQKEGKCVFIYNEYIKGSGLILFSKILAMFGFSKATGKEKFQDYKPRYISFAEVNAPSIMKKLINRFNQPDNSQGKVINVILGSRKISEGFSFFHIQVEEIHTPWFNYSEIEQAIARGDRFGSHQYLENPVLTIYQRVSLSKTGVTSIDLYMYKIAEDKDISIKGIEYIIQESAWDCCLNYNRNFRESEDYSRDCLYRKCNYKCDYTCKVAKSLDYSTYQLYYNDQAIEDIIEKIKNLFSDKFNITLNDILNSIPEYSEFDILESLNQIIINNLQVKNKYGFMCYIKEKNNTFMLVDNMSTTPDLFSDYYTEYPDVKPDTSMTAIIEPLYEKSLVDIIQKGCGKIKTEKEMNIFLNKLPLETQEHILEASILAKDQDLKTNITFRNIILEYFKNYYTKISGIWISSLLQDKDNLLMCLKNGKWSECDEKMIDIITETKKQEQSNLEKNPYKVYGQYNKSTGDFCIRDVSEEIPDKKHKRTSGRRCNNWKKPDLLLIILDKIKMNIPSNLSEKDKKTVLFLNNMDKKELIKEINKNKYVKNRDVSMLSKNKLVQILFFAKLGVKPMCGYLYNWFDTKNLLVEDMGCGQGNKPKI